MSRTLAWGLTLFWCLACGAGFADVEGQSPEAERLERILRQSATRQALEKLEELLPSILEDQIALARIAAPTGREGERARWLAERLRSLGLADVRLDEVGNLLARRPGRGRRPVVLLSAHLDTVFDQPTIEVRQDGPVLRAPGIADDARGLASVLGLLRALAAAGIETDGELWIAATVGEEGLGDLRGAKHLYREGGPGRKADFFLTLDGIAEETLVRQALGSLRHRVLLRGPGGHSWADFGRPNPIQALGRAMTCMALENPGAADSTPRSSFNFGRIAGGTSINAIPQEAWVEVDLRSEDAGVLRRLESTLDDCLRSALEAERAWARPDAPRLRPEMTLVGERPSGKIPEDGFLVRAAVAASRAAGIEPRFDVQSTDANVPISLGLPALALGFGGRGGDVHSQSEWCNDPAGSGRALKRTLLLLLVLLEPAG